MGSVSSLYRCAVAACCSGDRMGRREEGILAKQPGGYSTVAASSLGCGVTGRCLLCDTALLLLEVPAPARLACTCVEMYI